MARVDKKTGEKVYMTEDRQYVVKEQMVSSIFNVLAGIKDVIVTADPKNVFGDPRIDALTVFLATYALDEDDYDKLIEERNALIDEVMDSDAMSPAQHNRKIFDINMKTVVKCQSNYDSIYGIKKKQEIMRVAPPEYEAEKEKYGGDEELGKLMAQGDDKNVKNN
jgi:hypothetical protein